MEEYEDELRVDLLAGKYQNTLSTGIVVSDAEVDRIYHHENEEFTVEYLYFNPQLFTEQVEIEDEELQKYFQQNPGEFEQPMRFKIEYFLLTLDQFKETAVVKEREIVRYYERNKEEYTTPVEVKARHILIKANMEMSAEEKAEKRKQAGEILQQLQQGADFEEVGTAVFGGLFQGAGRGFGLVSAGRDGSGF